nr:hypothetical protein [Tanacetum cinerariifolium]
GCFKGIKWAYLDNLSTTTITTENPLDTVTPGKRKGYGLVLSSPVTTVSALASRSRSFGSKVDDKARNSSVLIPVKEGYYGHVTVRVETRMVLEKPYKNLSASSE